MERQGVRPYLSARTRPIAGPIPQTEAARLCPFFSPDGRWMASPLPGTSSRKLRCRAATRLTRHAPNAYGGSWGTNGTILFAAEGRTATKRSRTGGGPQRVAVKDDRGSWTRPHMLPGGKRDDHVATAAMDALAGHGRGGPPGLRVETDPDRKGRRWPLCAEWSPRFARRGACWRRRSISSRLALSGPASRDPRRRSQRRVSSQSRRRSFRVTAH